MIIQKVSNTSEKNRYKSNICEIQPTRVRIPGTKFQKKLIEEPYLQKKVPTETFTEKVQSPVLKTNVLETHEEPNAYTSFGFLSRSSFR